MIANYMVWVANYEPFDFPAHPRNVREKRAEGSGDSYDSPAVQFAGGTISIQPYVKPQMSYRK